MKEVIALFVVIGLSVFLFGGQSISIDNPFDRTAEARIQADAAVRVAEVESAASVSVAQTWALATPILLLIVVGGGVVALVIHWQGKIYLERARSQRKILPGQPEFYGALREVARQENAQIDVSGGAYYLVCSDGQRQEVTALVAGE